MGFLLTTVEIFIPSKGFLKFQTQGLDPQCSTCAKYPKKKYIFKKFTSFVSYVQAVSQKI
jgi:hypothetical protein